MYCNKCGKELKENETFCSNCGSKKENNKQGMPFWKALILVVGIAILIIAGISGLANLMTYSEHKSANEYYEKTMKIY